MLERAEQGQPVGGPEHAAVDVDAHPLVGVGAVAVGELDAVVDPAQLRLQCGHPAHRRVDVQPDPGSATDLGDGGRRVERHRRRRASRRAHEEWNEPGHAIRFDHRCKCIGSHGERLVVGDDPHAVGADAGDTQALLDAGVGLGRHVADEPRRVAVVVHRPTGRPPACGQDGDQGGVARRPLDHATTGRTVGAESLGQAEQLLHPVHHQRLQLGARRRRDPAHALDAEPGRQQLTEDRRVCRVRREVGEEAGVLPVHDPRDDDLVDVGHHGVPRLRLRGRVGRQPTANVARLDGGRHRERVKALEVVGDPVDQLVTVLAELVGFHVLLRVAASGRGRLATR